MGYSVTVKPDHVYVQYDGVLKGLDIVRLLADPAFINDFRSKTDFFQKVQKKAG